MALKQELITLFALYGTLSVVNLFYLWKITSLQQKNFHLVMWLLLQLCFSFEIAADALAWDLVFFKQAFV